MSVSGDTALVGASGDDDFGVDSGSAYVFLRSGTSWTEEQKLTASDAAAGDHFGSVSVSGDTVLVGAPGDDDFGQSSGAAYAFVRSGNTWSEQQKLTASDAAQFEGFAISVSVSGDIALIGAPYDDDGLGANSGSTYAFLRNGTNWSEEQKLTTSDAAPGDLFGYSVSVSGDTALVGAVSHDDGSGKDSGAAYVFLRSGMSWTEQQKLTASDAAVDDLFGTSVSVRETPQSSARPGTTTSARAQAPPTFSCESDDTALVGAPFDNTFSHGQWIGACLRDDRRCQRDLMHPRHRMPERLLSRRSLLRHRLRRRRGKRLCLLPRHAHRRG